MSRLDDFKNIVDQQLADVKMSEQLKQRVRDGIAEREKAPGASALSAFARKYKRQLGAAAALAACAAVFMAARPFITSPITPNEPQTTAAAHAPATSSPAVKTINVTAQEQTPGGVLTTSGFLIRTEPDITENDLLESLVVKPQIDYTLLNISQGEFLMTPVEPLEKGTIYKIAMTAENPGANPLTWVFQTESDFKVVSTLPADGSTYVRQTSAIEITLSREPVDFEGKITLSPAVKGQTELHGKTLVFVPLEPLAPDTVYTVAVSQSLSAFTGESLDKPHTFSFRTEYTPAQRGPDLYLSGALTEAFSPGDPVVLSMYTSYNSPSAAGAVFDVTVYSVENEMQYLDLAREHEAAIVPRIGRSSDYTLSAAGLGIVQTVETTLLTSNSYSYFLVMPEPLEPGYYLIDARAKDAGAFAVPVVQKLVCVSDIVVWSQSSNGQALVWLNDASTGRVVSGASVSAGQASALTDRSGVALLETQQLREDIIVTSPDGKSFADRVNMTEPAPPEAAMLYSACVYIDRAAYLPTDTIHLWGYIAPRDGGQPPPTVEIVFSTMRLQLSVSAEGTFSGQIALENMLSTYESLTVRVDGGTVASVPVSVMEYTKPSYVINAEFDKRYYHIYDTANAAISVNFFDGTPAASITVAADRAAPQTTDSRGETSLSVAPRVLWNISSWRPYEEYMSFYTTGQEDSDNRSWKSTIRFPTDYMPEIDFIEDENGGVQVSARTSVIDFSAVTAMINAGTFDLYAQDLADQIRGRAFNAQISIDVMRREYIATETGTKYDFINKTTYKTYSYHEERTSVESFTIQTRGGQVSLSKPLDYTSEGMVSYYITATLTLPDGIVYTATHWIGGADSPWGYSDVKYYYLGGETLLETDQTASLSLFESGRAVQNEGTIVYSVARQTVESYGITGDSTLSIDFTRDMIPNVTVTAAYFDGKHIYSAGSLYLRYDPAARALNVEITTDKQTCAPGERVTATIKITDSSGEPLAANYVLSVADEAAFAVTDQYVDMLSALYGTVYYDYPSIYASTVQHSINAMYAEEGGEGSADGVRDDFADTAGFITGKTNTSGIAVVAFTVPDNLTSWRVTACAVSAGGEGFAGQGRSNVSVSIPFFANVIANKKYTAGDDIVFSARAAGTAVTPEDSIAYTATLSPGGEQLTAGQLPGDYAYFNFGKLPEGSYSINIHAQTGGKSDQIGLDFEVLQSLHEVPVTTVIDPARLDTLRPLKYPLTLIITDPARSQYFEALTRVLGGGNRADQRLGRVIALAKLSETDPEIWANEPGDDLSGLQIATGALSLLPYSEGDARLTAKALAAAPELINEKSAADYLESVVYNRNSTESDVASAYLGLAAAGRPVLIDIYRLLETGGFSAENQLMLAWGLALLGDTASAHEWYEAYLAPYGVATGTLLKIALTGETEYDYAITSQAAALAAAISHPDSQALMSYVLGNSSTEYLPTADILAWLNFTPQTPAAASFSYVQDGQIIVVDLSKTPVHLVRFNQSQLAKADFQTISGTVRMLALYTGGADDLQQNSGGLIDASREYTENADGTYTVSIDVTLDPDAPQGTYLLSDALPSGLRFVRAVYTYGGSWSLIREQAGKLTFALYSGYNQADGSARYRTYSFNVKYIARAALPGEFVADSIVVSHSRTRLNLVTDRSTFAVK